jgi:hypothetical protein
MELQTPLKLGGSHYLEAVSVGRDPDARTVRDCPACTGHLFDDKWHLVATVRNLDTRERARHYYCSGDCLRGWLRLFLAT